MKTCIRILAFLLLSSGAAVPAGLFPDLSKRYPVGDPDAPNPLDPNREGPKCIAAGDLDGDGVQDIVAGNLDGSVSILLSAGEGGLREQALVRAGGSIRGVAVADLDMDGKADIVAADITHGLWVFLGNGDGSFHPAPKIILPKARALAIGDVDVDGKPDLLVAGSPPDCENYGGMRFLCLLQGFGNGAFGPPEYLVRDPEGCLYDVALADLDGDGNLDALALEYRSREVLVFAGRGAGTFAPETPDARLAGRMALPEGGPRSFTVGYLDERLADGVPPPGATLDIAIANRDRAAVEVFLGQGGFAWSGPTRINSGAYPRAAAAGDLNGDGLAELVVTNRNDNTISILRGLGDGRFGAPLELAAGTSPRDLVLADVTGDGALDAAVANRISEDISLFVGRRGLAGFLVPEDYYPAGVTPVGVVAADFDGDGRPDAATVNLRSHDVRVRLNTGGGRFGEEAVYPVNFLPSSMVSGDLDGDGRIDLAVACMGTGRYAGTEAGGSLVSLLGNGDGTFRIASTAAGGAISFQPYWLRAGDLSGDKVPDAIVGGRRGEIVLFTGNGDGGFRSPVKLAAPPATFGQAGPVTVTLGDVDSDGRRDIIASGGRILMNDGHFLDGAWQGRMLTYPVDRGDWVVETADLDGDGHLDLIVALTFVQPDPIAVHFGRGDGTFEAPTIYPTGMGVVALAAEDMDRDGILDIVAGNRCTADVTILRGLGDRRFERLETVRTYSVEGVAVADIDGDGRLDLVGAGLALWAVRQGSEEGLADPQAANIAGALPREGVWINELMAWNKSFPTDAAGGTDDWLELYNHGAAPVSLEGWILRQRTRSGNEADFVLPGKAMVPAMGHLLVVCGGGAGPGSGLTAPFALERDGEAVLLLDPARKEVDAVEFPVLPADVSFARFADGARYLCYNPIPTPGAPNGRPSNIPPSLEPEDPFLAAPGSGRIGLRARTFDDVGLAYASVHYRIEGEAGFGEAILDDDGAHGDGEAHDGILGTILPAFPAGARIEYWFRAVDLDGEVTTVPDDSDSGTGVLRAGTPPAATGLRVAEVLPFDSAGGADWVEIANCGEAPAALDGLALGESYDAGKAWPLPAGLVVAPGDRIVVWCSGRPEMGPLHATFRLKREGGPVYLMGTGPAGAIVDLLEYPSLLPGTSYGIAGCGSEAGVLRIPTPGAPNAEISESFRRGDGNGDGAVDLADAVFLLQHLFSGGPAPACADAADADDTGVLDLTDPITVLAYLYIGGQAPPEPLEACGLDRTLDGLDCGEYRPCE